VTTPQMPYGFLATSNWGEGDARAEYIIGDVVYVPKGCSAVLSHRCKQGLHRVEACFSIGEDASFYYRLSPSEIVGAKGTLRVRTDWDSCSDRLHVIPGGVDFTAGWILLFRHVEAGA
jgi:hypothetical protein